MERRAQQLLSLLSEDEIAEIRIGIELSERRSLCALFEQLVEGESESVENPQLFSLVFGRKWSKKEDYLLRNELRLLSERCYELIARRENRRDLEREPGRHNLMLLRGLLNRQAFKVFENLYGKFREDALNRLDYGTVRRLNEVWFDYMVRYREITPAGMQETRELLLENLDHLKRTYRNDISENQHRRVVVEQNLLVMGQETELTEIGLDLDFSNHDIELARFHDAISRAHASRGEERIAHARQGFEEIRPVADKLPAKALFGYAILASVLYAEFFYEEAESTFNEGLAFARQHSLDPPPEMLFNYAGTLMRRESYQNVLDLLDEYHAEFEARPKLRFRSECFRCFCHIFLGDSVKAFEAIPPDLGQRAESEHNYFRFIYLILPYMNDDPEGALREVRNFIVYFNRNKEKLQFPQEKRMATLYRAFYSTIYNEVDEEKQRKELKKIQKDVQEFVESEQEYRDYLYVRWLLGEIDRRVKGE
ncbi:MAG: hypothetical protein KDD67_14765 [Ignavibacteriae bacterium]|nr:hypothetical protein [Ignavibacteriota bacterium]MCB9215128.1 hypothetical protein [Ignavibacteria bacterium]